MFFKPAVPYVKLSTRKTVQTPAKKVKVIFLGSSGVGKTSIVQQFISNYFRDDYSPTGRRRCYYPSVVLDDNVYDVKITDCPQIQKFPGSALNELSNYRGYGLRKATAYVLVFDVTDDASFNYIKSLREQIVKSRDERLDPPILVVGNKYDLLEEVQRSPDREEVDYYSIVRKQWKCAYVECSAKFDWHITAVFRELLSLIDAFHNARLPISLTAKDTLFQTTCSIS